MKRLTTPFLLLTPALLIAQNPQPKQADFPMTVHITYSRSLPEPGAPASSYQQLETVINGQEVELIGGGRGVLTLGDYPARPSSKTYAPKNHAAYDLFQAYDLQMPDGQTRNYLVTGLGPPATNP